MSIKFNVPKPVIEKVIIKCSEITKMQRGLLTLYVDNKIDSSRFEKIMDALDDLDVIVYKLEKEEQPEQKPEQTSKQPTKDIVQELVDVANQDAAQTEAAANTTGQGR